MPIFMRKIMQFTLMHFHIASFTLQNQDDMKSLTSLDFTKKTAHFLGSGPSTFADRYTEAYWIVTISWMTVQFQTCMSFLNLNLQFALGMGLVWDSKFATIRQRNRTGMNRFKLVNLIRFPYWIIMHGRIILHFRNSSFVQFKSLWEEENQINGTWCKPRITQD